MVVWTAVAVKLTFIIVLQSSSDWKLSIEKACSHVSIYSGRYVSTVAERTGREHDGDALR
jgi:hypothetical protein